MIEKIKSAFASIASWAVFIVPVLLYFIIDRQGRTISQLKAQITADKGQKDIDVKKQAVTDSTTDYDAAKRKYDDIRRKLP